MDQHVDYIKDLVHRMTIKTDEEGQEVRSSRDSVSWKAHQEAKQLKEEHWIDIAYTLLQEMKSIIEHKYLFFILAHLARHTQGTQAVEKMLSHFTSASPREQIEILYTFTYVPFIPNATPFLALSYAKQSKVRQDAISILGHCDSNAVGERMIELLSTSKNHLDLWLTLIAIKRLQLTSAAPYLITHLRSNKVDIRSLCIDLLSIFDGDAYLSIFEHHLAKDLSSSVKWSAMEAIAKHGTTGQVKLVLKRVKSIVSRPRASGGQYPTSELMYGISFLQRVASDDPVVMKWFQEIRTSKYDTLFDHEKKWLSEQFSSSL